jgi:tetratricopeptide (TPR) repeat protein
MHHRIRLMMLIVWFIALFPAAITAQESPDRRACNISDTSGASAKIAGCTRLIESGGQTPRQTAITLANRAMAYTWQNDIDRAIADFSEAIRLDPDFPNWRYARGMQYEKKGQHQLALADLNEAVRLRPGTAEYVEAVRRVQQNGSIKAVFERYSLLGIFASDCGKPAGADNFYYVNRVIDANNIQRDIMDGPSSRRHVTIISSAADTEPNEIAVAGTLNGNTPVTAVWRIEGARMVPMEVTESGRKTIAARILLATGREMPWLNKCQ